MKSKKQWVDLESISDFEKEMVTSTVSGWSKVKTGKPNCATTSGCIRTIWQPLSIRDKFFIGKSTVGPVNKQSQMKCFEFIWGVILTEAMLLLEPSEKLPLPMTLMRLHHLWPRKSQNHIIPVNWETIQMTTITSKLFQTLYLGYYRVLHYIIYGLWLRNFDISWAFTFDRHP